MKSAMTWLTVFPWLLFSPDLPAGTSAEGASLPAFEIRNPLVDPTIFPIAVWLQDPAQAARYKQAGFNLYVGLWKGPTEAQLKTLTAAAMPVVCEQNRVGLEHRDDPIIVGWMHGDEPDNAQEVVDRATGKKHYGPPVPRAHRRRVSGSPGRRRGPADHAQPGAGGGQR